MSRRSRLDIVIGGTSKGALTALNMVGSGLSRLSRQAVDVTKRVARISTLGAATAGAGVAAFGIKSAATFETLKLRMKAVTGDAKKAQQAFDDAFSLFLKTPLDLAPLMEADILLKGVGISGRDSLRQVAEAASTMGYEVRDVALAVTSLETETLKRFGIRARTVGDQVTFVFRDKIGNELTRVAQGADEARKALLGIFEMKFGGGLEEASKTLAGLWSSFKGLASAASAKAFEGVASKIKQVITGLNARLESLLNGEALNGISERLSGIADVFFSIFSGKGRATLWSDFKEMFSRLAQDFGDTLAAGFLEHFGKALKGTELEGFGDLMAANARRIQVEMMQRHRMQSPLFQASAAQGAMNVQNFTPPSFSTKNASDVIAEAIAKKEAGALGRQAAGMSMDEFNMSKKQLTELQNINKALSNAFPMAGAAVAL